jgi:hypothetical protein
MTRTRWILSFGLLGCSASEDPEPKQTTFPKNDCVTAGAAYQYTYAHVSGSCGALPARVEVVPEDGILTIEAGCDGVPRYEGCSVFLDMSCTDADGLTVHQSGKVDWATDGSTGTGTITMDAEAANGQRCSSTYNVNAVRL